LPVEVDTGTTLSVEVLTEHTEARDQTSGLQLTGDDAGHPTSRQERSDDGSGRWRCGGWWRHLTALGLSPGVVGELREQRGRHEGKHAGERPDGHDRG
jgi:hypothetical protein